MNVDTFKNFYDIKFRLKLSSYTYFHPTIGNPIVVEVSCTNSSKEARLIAAEEIIDCLPYEIGKDFVADDLTIIQQDYLYRKELSEKFEYRLVRILDNNEVTNEMKDAKGLDAFEVLENKERLKGLRKQKRIKKRLKRSRKKKIESVRIKLKKIRNTTSLKNIDSKTACRLLVCDEIDRGRDWLYALVREHVVKGMNSKNGEEEFINMFNFVRKKWLSSTCGQAIIPRVRVASIFYTISKIVDLNIPSKSISKLMSVNEATFWKHSKKLTKLLNEDFFGDTTIGEGVIRECDFYILFDKPVSLDFCQKSCMLFKTSKCKIKKGTTRTRDKFEKERRVI